MLYRSKWFSILMQKKKFKIWIVSWDFITQESVSHPIFELSIHRTALCLSRKIRWRDVQRNYKIHKQVCVWHWMRLGRISLRIIHLWLQLCSCFVKLWFRLLIRFGTKKIIWLRIWLNGCRGDSPRHLKFGLHKTLPFVFSKYIYELRNTYMNELDVL